MLLLVGLLGVVPAAGASLPIHHVIEIMLENHSFDDLFGHFPGAAGIAPGTTLPSPVPGGAPVSPIVAPRNEGEVQGGLNNSRAAELTMMDDVSGRWRMDGYSRYAGEGLSSITGFSPAADPNLQYLARRYELAEDNFQPLIAPTLPNVLAALAGTAEGLTSNAEPPTRSTWHTIFGQLAAAGLDGEMYSGVPASLYRGTVWPSLLAPGHRLLSLAAFLEALRRGDLPAFSFVRPGVGYSEEPPEDLSEGDAWLGQLLAAIGRSPEWSSTAVFVTYDEGGGFWDGVAPSVASGYGTRTPLLIVSPYARRGLLAAETTNVGVLAFVRTLFHLPALTALEARQNDLLEAFDFGERPLPSPAPPRAPGRTVAFFGAGELADPGPVAVGQTATIRLELRDVALRPVASSGTLAVQIDGPRGTVRLPSVARAAAVLNGSGTLRLEFDRAGYYRVELTARGVRGWFTLDVGVTPNTP